jgi:Mn2+/Fe2+ NRAMP family transporter
MAAGSATPPRGSDADTEKTAKNATLSGRLRRYCPDLGPGLITGCADDDPSGISTYSMAGAAAGYGLLWTALLSLPQMISVQMMCERLGMVTGRELAGVIPPR